MRGKAMEPVSFGIVGVGGYAASHVRSAEALEKEGLGRVSAVVIRNPEKHREVVAHFQQKNVAIYESYEAMLEAERGRTEIVALPVAIHQHKAMTISALQRGFNVIVEKPPAATIQDVDEMIEAERRSGRFCAVGFQSQSKNTALALKGRICEGRLGEIKKVLAKARWKRLDSYYERNAWAGKLIIAGQYILDGTVNNPLAHYLMNDLYFASRERGKVANPLQVRAELYRGHNIEGEDTSCVVVDVDSGARVYFFATLCAPVEENPVHEVVGTLGKAEWTVHGDVHIEYANGKREIIRDDGRNERVDVFRNAARYLRGVDKELNCPLSMTRPFVLAANGAYESAKRTRKIPDRFLIVERERGSVSTTIKNIVEIINQAFDRRKLYSDLGVEWAYSTEYFSLLNYRFFSMWLPDRPENRHASEGLEV